MSNKYTLKAQYNYKGNLWKPGKVVDSKDFDIAVLIRDGAILEPYTGENDYPVEAAASRALRGQAPTAENGTGSPFIDANDSIPIFPTVDHLKGSSAVLKNGQTVYVKSIDRFFTWHLGFAGVTDGLRSFDDDNETGYFLYIPIASKLWIEQTSWYVSPLGDDENPGTSAKPIATFEEWLTRTQGYYKDGTVINLVPDPDGANTFQNLKGVLCGDPFVPNARLTIQGTLRLLEGPISDAVITKSDYETSLKSIISVTGVYAYDGKLVAASPSNQRAYVIAHATDEVSVINWNNANCDDSTPPTTDTDISFYESPTIASVELYSTEQGNNTTDSRPGVILKDLTITSLVGANLALKWVTADSVDMQGDMFFECSSTQTVTNNTKMGLFLNFENCWLYACNIYNSTVYYSTLNYITGDQTMYNCDVQLNDIIWLESARNGFVVINKTMVDAVAAQFGGTVRNALFQISNGSKVNAPQTNRFETAGQSFVLDGKTRHIPQFAGGELAIPAEAKCEEWAQLEAAPFNDYCESTYGSSIRSFAL